MEISVEFFPPKSEDGAAKLRQVREQLTPLAPEFYSVTFGAGGSTRDRTRNTVAGIQAEGRNAVPHITCVDSTREQINALLDDYQALGIDHVLALRGDLPSGVRDYGDFKFASDLVEHIRQQYGDTFTIDVASYPEVHPQAKSAKADLDAFVRKVQAGADSSITQYFFNPDAYFHFRDRSAAAGVSIPIVPGIMPITNYDGLARFSKQCGAELPRWLDSALQDFGEDTASLRAFGIDVVSELVRRLIEGGAPGLHFYTMNRAESALAIWRNLDLQPNRARSA